MDNELNIGAKIKYYRNLNNMTQKKLAENIDKSVETIKKYENGSIIPPTNVLKKMANIFNIPIWSFIDNSSANRKNPEFDDLIYGLLSNGIFIENAIEHFNCSIKCGEDNQRFLITPDGKEVKVNKADLSEIYLALENTMNFEIKRILRNNGVD